MIRCLAMASIFWGSWCSVSVLAADYRVEAVSERPEHVAEAVGKLLAPQATRVFRGSRPLYDIWLCRELPVTTFQAEGDIQFPLTAGQLVGVIRVHRKTTDFRGQDMEPGTYTLRFALQPVDGAHVGTSPTRDFLLLLPVGRDTDPQVLEYKKLTEWSTEVSGTSHPCLLCLQRPVGDEPVRSLEDRGWWLVRLSTKIVHESKSQPLSMDLVVEGQAEG